MAAMALQALKSRSASCCTLDPGVTAPGANRQMVTRLMVWLDPGVWFGWNYCSRAASAATCGDFRVQPLCSPWQLV